MKYENFNDAEALKIAVNIEEEGLEFYSILMKNTKDPKTKEIFSKLASDEKEHLARFQKAYLELTSPISTTQSCEDYTVDLYLKYLVDTGVFAQKGQARRLAAEVKTDIDALKIGIQAEKDSILYYAEAAKNTRFNAGKQTFEQLAIEEKKHLKLLAEQLKTLKKPAS
ncbi:MAG: ferritin family protein [Planctomycetota bacterium]|nr:ferritin family protein [Planctomycetota bacterium]MDE1889362.1 ferritin family protein [Planctomycetota bacterium]MDE2215690.1 ferritin family protein [Planctomycetota bacterium]